MSATNKTQTPAPLDPNGSGPTDGRLLVRVTVPASADVVPALQTFMADAARPWVDSPDELAPLGELVREVALHVVRTAFDPGEEGEYTAELLHRAGQIVFAIEDKGLPAGGISTFLPSDLAHAVEFRNLGRGGKRLEVARTLRAPAAEPLAADAEGCCAGGEPPRAEDEVELRLLEPADAPSLSRLMYRSYGYTYGSEFVYYPERIVEMLASGRLVSYVAVNEGGEVVGHLAMLRHGPDSTTGETAMAAVDPRYRGRRLFERMKEGMGELARQHAMFGLYSEAVAVHTFTQKGNLALGGFETGFLLGFTPATQVFRKISDGQAPDRRSAVLFYLRTNDEPARVIYAPERHQAIMEAIVRRGGMNRSVQPPAAELSLRSLQDQVAVLDVAARPDVGRAFLTLRRFGADVLKRVQDELRELCRHGYACVYLELPLSDPMTAVLCKGFESFGFFFAGLLFEVDGCDALRLQYLNGVTVRRDDIQVASDFGRSLLDYVVEAKETVERARVERRKFFPQPGHPARRRKGERIEEAAEATA
ncbi:GNAT family N-acetyltransferase [Azospirillum rugosum]|uniref:Serine/threonine-protein kinase RsbW n=1 Tax=Azospirillum rugosum TaxID=416170 RepID=A0ABS4SGH4_9PROT|nr:GNAT family N-acetyltransferase [Azospirillum rugosum]MBP2291530.1 serine/threonine-protein kinase RsbW [Azospirillum rugosum]MDQ0525318.1 serine/threonine-protein kinase RsbW [Azospirillum rugosum]